MLCCSKNSQKIIDEKINEINLKKVSKEKLSRI